MTHQRGASRRRGGRRKARLDAVLTTPAQTVAGLNASSGRFVGEEYFPGRERSRVDPPRSGRGRVGQWHSSILLMKELGVRMPRTINLRADVCRANAVRAQALRPGSSSRVTGGARNTAVRESASVRSAKRVRSSRRTAGKGRARIDARRVAAGSRVAAAIHTRAACKRVGSGCRAQLYHA